MDKVSQYKKIVGEFASYIASISPSDDNVETQLITDDKHGHYLSLLQVFSAAVTCNLFLLTSFCYLYY
jgi:XisI protein